MSHYHQLQEAIAITLLPNVGTKHAKNLIAHCGSPRAVFEEKKQNLLKIPGIGGHVVEGVTREKVMERAEKEVNYILKHHIQTHYFLDKTYPQRLRNCEDGPLVLFQLGKVDLNPPKVLAVVGTRNSTSYGEQITRQFCEDLAPYQPLLVSGLAYGIDITAHKGALQNKIPTAGVVAHGLDRLYPELHRKTARQMIEDGGGLVTEFLTETNPDRENFPMRNRIIAGMCDAVVVVEAAKKGGALITAKLANSYSREVFAFPGRITDEFSEGCNNLIKSNLACLINSVKDFEYLLNWKKNNGKVSPKSVQKELFVELSAPEKKVVEALRAAGGEMALELLCMHTEIPVNQILSHLMSLELHGLVSNKPGKMYALRKH